MATWLRASNIAILALSLIIQGSVKCNGGDFLRETKVRFGSSMVKSSEEVKMKRNGNGQCDQKACQASASFLITMSENLQYLYQRSSTWVPSESFMRAYLHGSCYIRNQTSTEYSGTVSRTANGRQCQRWDEQFPHKHKKTDIENYPDFSFSTASNRCRDPDNSGFAWCYTTDPDVRWEACDVTKCFFDSSSDVRCYDFTLSSTKYAGRQNRTTKGYTCQRWASQYPHQHRFNSSFLYPEGDIDAAGNYCRDPEGWGLPWCYTTSPYKRWDVCDLAKCSQKIPSSSCSD